MTKIERLRNSKPQPACLSWIWLAGSGIWFLILLIDLFADKAGLAVVNAACFATFLILFFATHQERMNKDLLHEIDKLRDQIGKNPINNNSQPPSPGDVAHRAAPEK